MHEPFPTAQSPASTKSSSHMQAANPCRHQPHSEKHSGLPKYGMTVTDQPHEAPIPLQLDGLVFTPILQHPRRYLWALASLDLLETQ